MRRIGLMIVLVSLFSLGIIDVLAADNTYGSKTRYYRHEINVSRTWYMLPNEQWYDNEDKVYDALSLERSDGGGVRESSSGTLFSYYYHFNQYIAIGGMMAFTSYDSSLDGDYRVPVQISYEYWDRDNHRPQTYYRTKYEEKHVSGGKIKEKSFFLMPSVKWSWLNNNWCSLYMKASLGMHYQHMNTNTEGLPLKDAVKLDKNKLWIAYLATPFGWEIGKQKIRAFFEFGFGSNFNLQIGLTCRFGRFEPIT